MACLTLYDALGLRFAGVEVPYPRLALISFMGYAIGHNVGLNTLTGGAIRYRAYSPSGPDAQADRHGHRLRHVDVRVWGRRLCSGLSLLSQAAVVGLGVASVPSDPPDAGGLRAARRRGGLSVAGMLPARVGAFSQDS